MPSGATLAAEGIAAIAAGKYTEGIEKLSEALKDGKAPLWHLERSKAYLRTKDLDRALYDAEKALRIAFDRANRILMIEAQIRRAVTFLRMGRPADADVCAFWAVKLCEGARATEKDGQQSLTDSNGDYPVTAAQVQAECTPPKNEASGVQSAMKSPTKEQSLKNMAIAWRLQAAQQLDALPAGSPGRKVQLTDKYPDPNTQPAPISANTKAPLDKSANSTSESPVIKKAVTCTTWEQLWEQFQPVHTKNDIRSSFYQTNTHLMVDFFVKNVPKDTFEVQSQSQIITLGKIPSTQTGSIQLFLSDEVDPAETKYTVKSMKIELILKKRTPGKWASLRKADAEILDNIALPATAAPSLSQFTNLVSSLGFQEPGELQPAATVDDWYTHVLATLRAKFSANASRGADENAVTASLQSSAPRPQNPTPQSNAQTPSAGPAYPTSSKKGATNWDAVDLGGEDEAPEGDVNSFFQKLYKDADEDTRRAMMKSYVESNGTSLSTSWNEAKDKTYETKPPDGSEAKKWT